MPKIKLDDFVDIQALNKDLIRTKDFHNLLVLQKPRTDLGRRSDKNHLVNRLVRLAHKFAKSVIKTNSKMQKSKTYDEVINNLVHRNK